MIANPILDWFMPFITTEKHWTFPLILAWLMLVVFGGRKARTTALVAAVTLLFTDQIVNFLLKPLIGRTRPCFVLEHVRLLIHQPHSFSFPSSHAANAASIATLLSIQYRKFAFVLIPVAILIGISRMYVGVHYPSDVAAGLTIGVLIALGILWLEQRIEERLFKKQVGSTQSIPATEKDE